MLNPESVATFPERLRINRNLAYSEPRPTRSSPGPGNFDVPQCSGGVGAQLDPASATDPAFTARTDGDVEAAQDLFDRLKLFAFDDQLATDAVPTRRAAPSRRRSRPSAPRARRPTTRTPSASRRRGGRGGGGGEN